MKIKKRFRAFTLAEVLITLAVIGVVAALTIPAVVKNVEKAQYEAGYKKAYSIIDQATKMIMMDNSGTISGLVIGSQHDVLRNKYVQYIKTAYICDWGDNLGKCWHANNQWYHLGGDPISSVVVGLGFVNVDGSLMNLFSYSGDCSHTLSNGIDRVCHYAYVDTNGFKGPNVYGKDIHLIFIRANGISTGALTSTDCGTTEYGYTCGWEILNGTYDWEN